MHPVRIALLLGALFTLFPGKLLWAQKAAAPAVDSALLQQQLQQLAGENQQLQTELVQLRKSLAQAALFDQRNRELEQRMVELERELQLLQQENRALQDGNEQGWFLRGAGVLLLGLVLGALIPQINRRKAPRWGDL